MAIVPAASKGGASEDWDFMLSEGLKFGDLEWVEGARSPDSWKEVLRQLGEGRIVEYRCYDARGGKLGGWPCWRLLGSWILLGTS